MEENTNTTPARQDEAKLDLSAENTLKTIASVILVLGGFVGVACVFVGITGLIGGEGALFLSLLLLGAVLLAVALLICPAVKVFADMSVALKEINSKIK